MWMLLNAYLSVLLALLALPVVLLTSLLGFVLSLWTKNNGYADVLYPWYFILVTVSAYVFWGGLRAESVVPTLIMAIVLLWGLRLSLRIFKKNRGKPEDFRYAKWRADWTWFRTRSFFQIYLLQGLIALLIVFPAYASIAFGFGGANIPLLLIFGAIVWIIGFLFEVVGDWQLDQFVRNPENKGKIMMEGLWRYSRHPNYFGEATMWWGVWLMAVSVVPGLWPIYLCSPLLITFLLLKVSGVPMLESRWEGREDWVAYKRRTSVFIPLAPRG